MEKFITDKIFFWLYHKLWNWPNSQISECTCSISYNAPFKTEMCAFLFWIDHCWIWNRCILGFVKLLSRQLLKQPLRKMFLLPFPWIIGPISLLSLYSPISSFPFQWPMIGSIPLSSLYSPISDLVPYKCPVTLPWDATCKDYIPTSCPSFWSAWECVFVVSRTIWDDTT